MFRHKFFGIAAAATLGLAAVLGSSAAYAVKIVGSATADPTADDALASVTYAAETLLKGTDNMTEATDKTDTATYYNIGGPELFISGPADIAANPGDFYLVTFVLEGMVFQSDLATANLSPSGTFSLAAGGKAGDTTAVYRTTNTGAVATDARIALEANFAISGSAGTIKRTVTNRALQGIEGIDHQMTHTGTGIIKVAAALAEKAVPMNPEAEVAEGFKEFLAGRTTASVGTLMVGFKEMHRRASGSNAGDDVDMLDQIIDTTDDTATPPAPNSTVTFTGDFSFASKAFLHGDADCGAASTDAHVATPNTDEELAAAATELLVRDDEMVVAGTTMAVNVTEFDMPQHLCIMVDPDAEEPMRIEATTAYTAMGSYKGIADAAIGPMPEMQTLGMIGRNGVTVRLPYLTTNAKFSQRIRIVNRGAAALYTIDLQSGDMPTSQEDTLEANSVTDLMVGGENGFIDMIGGGRGATAGSLIIESQPSMIDVVSIQINRELGTTDTVNYATD